MVNLKELKKILGPTDIFPPYSKVKLKIKKNFLTVVDDDFSIFGKDFTEFVKKACVSNDAENPIEELVNFKKSKSIEDYFEGKSEYCSSPLDNNSDITEITFCVEIYYKNRSQLFFEDFLESVIGLELKCFWTTIRLGEKIE